MKCARQKMAERDADDNAQRDPEGQVAFKGGHAIPSGRCDTLAVFVDHALAVFLDERAALRRQQVEHVLGRSAEPDALRAADDGSVDQDRMRHHGIEQLRLRSEEHTSELQSLMRISYAVFCLKKT